VASVVLHGIPSLGPKEPVRKRKPQEAEGAPTVKDAKLDFWHQKTDEHTFAAVSQSCAIFLQLVASNPWSLGKHRMNGIRNEDTSIHTQFAHDALMEIAQQLGLTRDQFVVKPLMITTVCYVYISSSNGICQGLTIFQPHVMQLIKTVSNFRNRFRTRAVQAIKEHYNLVTLDKTELIDKARALTDGFHYIWHDHTKVYLHVLISLVLICVPCV